MMTNRRALLLFTAMLASAWATSVLADEVSLKNGDRLTGTITTDGSHLTVDTQAEGKVTIDLKNVKTFSSGTPADVVLTDGTHVHGRLDSGPDGSVTFVPDNGAAHAIAFGNLKAVNPPPVKWVGSILIGGLIARGNTDSDSLNAALDFSRRGEHDRITLSAQYIFTRTKLPGQTKQETADDLQGSAKYDYFFTPKLYGYGIIQAEHDVIAKLDIRLAPGVGIGYQWVETSKLSFNTEAGIGYLYRQYSQAGHTSSVDARAAYHLKWKVNDKINVFHDFEYLPGLDRLSNYFFSTDAGIRADLTKKMFTEFKIQYQYDSRPAPGRGSNDVRYILGVGWAF
jgi:putative salt-induced outer membrane protein YdiY